ncbi:hypothetical protein C0389_06720 [bacterium]|nr:hypothetical protein [bacterium]
MSLFRVLFLILLIAQVFPIYPFRKTHFLNYFIASALIDPIFYLIRHIITIDTYTYFLIATMILFVAFPYKDLKVKVFLFIPLLLTLLHYEYNHFISLIGIELVSVFMIYQLIDYFYDEIKQDEKGSLFLLLIMLLTLLDAIKIFLYFEYIYISVLLYPFFVASNILLLVVISIAGPGKKIKIPSFFLRIITVKISENGIPVNNYNSELVREKMNSFEYDSLDKEIVHNENINHNAQKLHLVQLPGNGSFHELTNMEMKVLSFLSEGYDSKEISRKLFVTPGAVYFHLRNIKDKLQICKTSYLVKFAIENRDKIEKTNRPAQSEVC